MWDNRIFAAWISSSRKFSGRCAAAWDTAAVCSFSVSSETAPGNAQRINVAQPPPGHFTACVRVSSDRCQQQEGYMTVFLSVRRLLVAFVLALIFASSGAWAQSGKSDYQPQVGQEGKDVIWVPTPQALVDKMLDMAKVTAKDYVIDLGSGDGRTVITAAKRGAKALGIEYNPDMVELSKRNAAKEGVSDKASFVKADLFESDFSKAQVITMFLLPSINMKLRPKILDLKPGTRIASNTFDMGEWKGDATDKLPGCSSSD